MALVSSITPTTSLYPGSPSIHARSAADSPPSNLNSNSPLVRKLPSPPSPGSANKTSSGQTMSGQPQTRREGSSGSGGGVYSNNSQLTPGHASRQSSSSSSASLGYVHGGGSSPSSSANSVRLPSPSTSPSPLLPPSRSASTPPSASSSSPARPSATSLPNQNYRQHHHHSSSSSSSSTPRIPPSSSGQHSSSQSTTTNYMQNPQLAHPSFVGQAFPPFAPPHAFAHPAFPFVPSPHPASSSPQNNGNNYVSYSPNGQLTPGASAEQQKRLQAFQQAQWANQIEMLRNQQQQQDGRKRTTSGPASSPTYYTTPLPYPPSPSPTLHNSHQQQQSYASFPAGAMLPHANAHGYPTPPGSVEGVVRGGESGGSSSGGSREGGYHPYRRDHHHQHHAHAKSSSSERSSSTPRSNSTTPSTSNSSHRAPAPKPQSHGRNESSSQPFPSSHASSPSISSVRSTSTLPPPSSSSSTPQIYSPARPRTQSSNSSSSSLHRPQQYEPLPNSSPGNRSRTTSFESNRSTTPQPPQGQSQNRPRPSPLGGTHQPLPVDSDEEESEDGGDSDDTAEATLTVNTKTTNGGVSRSATMTTIRTTPAVQAPTTSVAVAGGGGKGKEKEKEKEKKGMASRFKKAFGGGGGGNSSSSTSTTLTEAELDGRGPKGGALQAKPRRSSDSVSSSETNPRIGVGHYSHHASQPSIASSSSRMTLNGGGDGDSTRKAPSSRFRLLNSKLNSSTDNISISSTVSSASVMIRKLGQMGKLARRNSLMGLTKAFKKDKNKGDGEEGEVDPIKSKKDKKSKSGASLASVSHATAEIESSSSPRSNSTNSNGMSPAAALAKRQQMHYAEQEAAEREAMAEKLRLQQQSQHQRTDSDLASVKSGKSGRWGIGRSKTTDDVSGERTNAIEKEKEKLKSRSSKFGRLGFGGSKTDLHQLEDDTESIAGTERGGSALGLYRDGGDETPRQSLEVLAPPQSYATYGGEQVRRDSSSDYEPSLYRQGATPANSSQVRAVKGILKGAGTYSQDQYARPRPGFHRIRASSFDAPQQQGRPGSPGSAALVNTIPTQAQVDGVAHSSTTSPRSDTHPPTLTEQIHDSALSRVGGETPGGAMYGNPSMNASAPVLTQFAAQTAIRSNSAPGAVGRRIAFAANLSVHTTWPAAIYDRRAEPATCNRLTPTLAQQIKEELNSFKMEEMDVHPESRKLTHFFV
ncbi:uncharacterized protein JCM6883_005751 [Sporobolomyces salmoneus]|uniref:uncharacterized protein n=1 Tax=Sporobolomyces salmoneus TaxID=183962 RepID=UPI00317C9A60